MALLFRFVFLQPDPALSILHLLPKHVPIRLRSVSKSCAWQFLPRRILHLTVLLMFPSSLSSLFSKLLRFLDSCTCEFCRCFGVQGNLKIKKKHQYWSRENLCSCRLLHIGSPALSFRFFIRYGYRSCFDNSV